MSFAGSWISRIATEYGVGVGVGVMVGVGDGGGIGLLVGMSEVWINTT